MSASADDLDVVANELCSLATKFIQCINVLVTKHCGTNAALVQTNLLKSIFRSSLNELFCATAFNVGESGEGLLLNDKNVAMKVAASRDTLLSADSFKRIIYCLVVSILSKNIF
ncbi:hypothetical protein HELRODRAFT_179648 [Helobdella robusta]|uniref:Uncharacterized protein n=1 Tax=Helobdella robusta TaxID=6412 RepID=T1FEZ5_HELRO|nr:hypothetical protein HELRODRAFT_179648 [Helobdella robusta]ESN95300.1 hypothetical protein HELRODRAFT_179648 [Helobdella robusta]